MSTIPRRVVTGHTPDGVSIVVSDGPVPVNKEIPEDGVALPRDLEHQRRAVSA